MRHGRRALGAATRSPPGPQLTVASSAARSSPNCSVTGTAPRSRLKRSSMRSSSPNVNCELPPPVSNTASLPPPTSSTRSRRQVREPGFFLAGDDLDLDARPLADGLEQLVRVRGLAQAGGPHGHDRLCARLPRRVDELRDRLDGPPDRCFAEPAGLRDAFPEPRHLGAVDHRPQPAALEQLGDVELDRVRPDVDRGDAACHAACFAKYSSALRVFVCCSPERSTPRSVRYARASAAAWNASFVSQRVDSSRMREPSG